MTRQAKIPGPDHPITIDASPARVVARIGDMVIADTTSALTLREAGYPPVHYIPLADVEPTVLRRSGTVTYCPYKGDASYYHIALPGQELTDAVWTYETPYPAVDAIAGRVAFYAERVTVESAPVVK